MKKIKYSLLAILLILSVSQAAAQFSLSGEFRPRTEFGHGYKTLAAEKQNWSVFTAQRTRLNVLFAANEINTKLVLQDVRYWGSQPQLVTNEDFATSVHEAWAEVFLAKNFSLKAGRQELVYDDHRIFGNVGWAHQARSHDVALFKYEESFNFHIGFAHHEDADYTTNLYTGPDAYMDLQFGWFNKTWNKNSLSLLILNNGVPVMESGKQVTKYSHTIGSRFSTEVKKFKFGGNLYFQSGNHFSGKKISALNFRIEGGINNGISAGYEYLSGNSYNKNDKVYAFTPFYGTNHKFNGFMDYFYVGNHINSVGLQDAFLNYNVSIDKFSIKSTLHYFASAGELSVNAKNYLGTEIDLTFLYQVQQSAVISAGWSTMLAGENMELLKGGARTAGNHWAFIMLAVTPTFINKE